MRRIIRWLTIMTAALFASNSHALTAGHQLIHSANLFVPVRLEAENGQYQELTQLADAKASNGKYLRGKSPGKVQWKFNLTAAGWYALNFRYQSSVGESISQISRNQLTSGIGFGWTNQWYTHQEIYRLNAGENTLELTCGANTLDLDYVEIDTAVVQPEMTPVKNVFYRSQPRDIVTKLNAYGRTLINVTIAGASVGHTLETYPHQEDAWKIRLQGGDLATLIPGDHVLAFNFDSGESLSMNLKVMDARPPALLTIIAPHIGHGNSVLFMFPTGKTLLLDCADSDRRDSVVIPLLKRNDIEKLDYFYLSHYHSDHDGSDRGAKIMSEFNVDVYEDNRTMTEGQSLELEGTRIQIYNSFSGGSDENQESLSFQLKYRDFVYVHGGDVYGSVQSAIMNAYANDLKGHVFFANHHFHGSANADYMRAVDPFLVLVQADQAIYARSTYMDVFRKQTAQWLKTNKKRFIEAVPAVEVGTTVIRVDDGENWTYETYGDTLVPLIPFLLSNNHRYEDANSAPRFTQKPESLITSFTGTAVIEYTTDKTAWLRYDETDLFYQQMANAFDAGQGQILHQTTITGQHGETKNLYIRARDRFGNESPIPARCTVVFDTTAKPIPWHHPDYPDDDWKSGQAPIGFGNSTDKTTVGTVRTYYMRKSFTLTEAVQALGLLLRGHDGLIAYINGVQVARLNIQDGPVSYNAWALSEPATPYSKVIVLDQSGLQALRVGENVLALEVHAAQVTNPSLSADARLFNNIAIYSDLNQVWRYLDSGDDPPIYTRQDISSVAGKGSDAMPLAFHLDPNYPNPFNAATVLTFHLAKSAHVALEIYNPLGQHVATLLDQEMPAGEHRAVWHAENHSSGIYFIRLHSGGVRKTNKIALIR